MSAAAAAHCPANCGCSAMESHQNQYLHFAQPFRICPWTKESRLAGVKRLLSAFVSFLFFVFVFAFRCWWKLLPPLSLRFFSLFFFLDPRLAGPRGLPLPGPHRLLRPLPERRPRDTSGDRPRIHAVPSRRSCFVCTNASGIKQSCHILPVLFCSTRISLDMCCLVRS